MKRAHIHKKYLIGNKIKGKKYKKSTVLFITIVFIVLSIIWLFRFINKRLTPTLVNYASMEVKKLASIIINNSVTEKIAASLNTDDLFVIEKNSNGEIMTIDFNSVTVNNFLREITKYIEDNLRLIENGQSELLELDEDVLSNYDKSKLENGIIFEIPTGIVFQNSLLSNIGPKIPVRIRLNGDIISNVNTKVTDYGINNVLIETSINIELTEQIILPFTMDAIVVKSNVPIALKLVQGNIPNYYFNGFDKTSPNVSIPIE